MRRTVRVAAWVALASGSVTLGIACGTRGEQCERNLTCDPPGSGGAGGGGNPACDADPTQDASAVIDACGVFVSASAAPAGDGTKAKPFASFAEAAAASPKRVYVCAESYAESAGVSFSGGVEIYAGFTECSGDAGWTWSATAKATLNGPADAVALTLVDGDNHAENLNVVAADAAADGGSSIAMVASGGTLEVINGDLTAGAAKDGAAGAQHATDPMLDGAPGAPGVGVCNAGASNTGHAGPMKTCETGSATAGGNGGDGGEIVMSMADIAGSGGDGTPADANQPTKGLGGVGEGQGMPAATECSSGSDGASGAPGESGAGAMGAGTVSASGYNGVNGTAGTDGKGRRCAGGGRQRCGRRSRHGCRWREGQLRRR